jgi:hypothetical protein
MDAMKWLGAILMLVGIETLAGFSDVRPEPDRAWILWIIRVGIGGLFFVGLGLFGWGLKQEVVDEIRRGPPADRGGPS